MKDDDSENKDWILDQQTKKILKTLIENPERMFDKKGLAEEAGISRDALYNRWDSIDQIGVFKEKSNTYGLNEDKDAVELLKKLLNKVEAQA
jgi:hypothetical protein